MLQRAASNAYSWWWASHIRTKQSKWLDNNLQDMEDRVQSMLKIIEEDADSFARRAEMYYKRRPELINCVEESYRAYRALAERYDHISGELHKANHTIATAFPDQVHYEMHDEDDDGSPTAISPIDSAKIPKPPAQIPQISFRNKTRKIQSALKKPQHRRINSAEKSEAQEEIDRLYKRILVLQTEKEFIKSSYESGLARYWEIEKQVAEMQGEVCCLQDEFSANAFIEDDEARALMAATALKSCEDTLVNLQEQQKRSSELARIESKRIQDAGEKLRALKGESVQTQMENGGLSCENADASILISCMEEEVYGLNQERLELDSLSEKVREHFDVNSDTSVVEVAEKINELVNKVIGLETTVSSQTVQIDRLRSETDELQKHLQSLEEEKLTLIGDSNILGDKLRQAEEELRRIQNIEKSVQGEKKILHTHFAEACHSLNDLSEKLQSPKHQDVISSARAFQDEDLSPLKSLRELKEREDIGPQDTKDSSADEWACHVQEPGVCLKELDDHVQSKTDSTLENDSEKLRSPKEEVLAIQDQKDNIVEEEVHSIRAHVSWLEDKGIHAQSEIERQLKKDPNQQEEVTTIKDTGDTLIKEETRMTQEPDLGDKIQENDIQAITGSQLKTVSEQSKYLEKEVAEIQDREEHLSEEKDLVMSEHGLSLKDEENVYKAESKNELDSVFFEDPKQEDHLEEKDSLQEDDNNHPSNEPPIQRRDKDCTLNLQQLLLNGLEGREKILLSEYTSILRNYKEAKKRLSEAERMNEEYRFETMAQIGELKRANAMKDEEIRFLGQKLSSLQGDPMENPSAPLLEAGDPSYRKLESKSSFPRLMAVSSSSRRLFSRSLKGINKESKARTNASFDVGETENPLAEDGIKLVHIGEPRATSALEEKFRRHIDTLLEENLEFWLRFSTAFHYVQKFQTTFEDLQEEIKKLKDSMTQEGSSSSGLEHAIKPETAPIDKQLRELKTELQVWLEQNVMLREELQKRLASLCDIQDEISAVLRSSKAEEFQFTPYQAAKFQGEVLNMQQENNKVADELKVGLDHVKALQVEVEKALSKLHESFELHGSRSSRPHNHFRHFSSRTRIPLRSFLFGTKPKKPSIFSCTSPPLQKQCTDLRAASLPT